MFAFFGLGTTELVLLALLAVPLVVGIVVVLVVVLRSAQGPLAHPELSQDDYRRDGLDR